MLIFYRFSSKMLKDMIETMVKELQNEKNQEHINTIFEPVSYRLKTSFYIVIILLILMLANLVYSNILLTEIIKGKV
jgi:hypothetical protein